MLRTIILIFSFFIISCERDLPVTLCPDEVSFCDPDKMERKVIIIGIDGFRSDVLRFDVSPFMYNLSLNSDVYFTSEHQVEKDTYSGPNWSSILTGVHYDKHNVIDNTFAGHRFNYYPPFQFYIEDLNSQINTVSVSNWTPINTYICKDFDYAPEIPLNDSMVFQEAKEVLINSNPLYPDLLFLHFDELDAAGHSHGFSGDVKEYTDVLTQLDIYIEKLFEIIELKRLQGEDWMFVIISDHGGYGTGHGDADNEHINKTVFFAQHPNILFKNNYVTSQVDLAPTVLDFMGISNSHFDCKTDGFSIIE